MSALSDAVRTAAEAALPPLEGEIEAPGLDAPVEVLRDRWGVPHVYAQSREDLWFAQGFIQTSERTFQMDLLGRSATGRLSELFGELTLPIDRFTRTIGWHRAAKRQVEEADDLSRDVSARFARGANAWLERAPALPPEYVVLGTEPGTMSIEDAMVRGAATGLLIAWTLSRNWINDLIRAEVAERLGPEAMAVLFPDVPTEPSLIQPGKGTAIGRRATLDAAFRPPAGQGSNNWVVAGDRTATGKPLLANDPHLALQTPSIWYEVHLHAPDYHAAGVALPFVPGVLLGHNERIAWGFTNSEGDVQDLYLERLSEDGTKVEYDGRWEPVTIHREEIPIRGREESEVLEVRETRHGPIVDSYTIGVGDPEVVEGGVKQTYAIRWVGYEHGSRPSAVIRLSEARSWDEFREALRGWTCPGNNVVYADVEGNIGYQLSGHYPIRPAGDGTVPLPGWSSEYEWQGWVPFDELPRDFNPEQGFIATANHRLYGDDYPHDLGHEFFPPYRVRRVAELLTATERHSRETFAAIQYDTVSLPARRLVPLLLLAEAADDRQKEAHALLAEWGHDLAANSPAAAIYEVWVRHLSTRMLEPMLGAELLTMFYERREGSNAFVWEVLPEALRTPTERFFGEPGTDSRDRLLRESLDAALDELTERLGEDMTTWRWGALHRARWAGRLALVPDLAELFTAGEVEVGGDEMTVQQAMYEPGVPYDVQVIPSWRAIYDPSDWDQSVGVHPPGQSGNPASPHWNDLLPLWAEGKHHPLPFTRDAVERHTKHRLTLRPE